jgi:hypothetical protein
MAFAVKSVDDTLNRYQTLLGIGADAKVVVAEKARIKVAIFNVGDVEYQLNESLDATETQSAIDTVLVQYGTPRVLIHNAALLITRSMLEITLAQ